MLARWILAAAGVSLALGLIGNAHATHPIYGQNTSRTMLWRDLELGGDGIITYKLCGPPGPPIQAEWAASAEAWDVALAWEFQEVLCSQTADTLVTWETSGPNICAPGLYGCWKADCTFHGSHCDIISETSRILFDTVDYPAPDSGGHSELPDSFEWRKFGMLHEWSHVVGLESHGEVGYDCNGAPQPGTPTVTDGFVNFDGPVCPQGPGSGDVGSVRCTVYMVCILNPGFETADVCDNVCSWRRIHAPGGTTNWQRLSCCNPQTGSWFLRINSWTVPGGSVYQDLPDIVPSPGESYVFSVWARAPSGCVLTTLRLWGLGAGQESGATRLNICSSTWTNYRVPLDAQQVNNFGRAEIYVDQANKQLDLDSTALLPLSNWNASFETPSVCDAVSCAWRRLYPDGGITNWARIQDLNRDANASGEWYLRFNRTSASGVYSVYSDVFATTSQGQSYTLWIWMRQGQPWPAPTMSGTLRLWALGGSGSESVSYNFTLNSPYWTQFGVTLNVGMTSHTSLRAEVYLNTPNVNYDLDGTRVQKNN